MTIDLQDVAQQCHDLCEIKDFGRDWIEAGCCLHLEVSEFIEALRGKKGDPTEEAGDILFVLLSVLVHHGIPVQSVINMLEMKTERRKVEALMETGESA